MVQRAAARALDLDLGTGAGLGEEALTASTAHRVKHSAKPLILLGSPPLSRARGPWLACRRDLQTGTRSSRYSGAAWCPRFYSWTGAECPAQLSRNIAHFVSRDAMGIEGLGDSIVDQLIRFGQIQSPADLYYLTFEQLSTLWKKGDKAPKKLLASIEASKENDLSKLIYALGIRQVGAKAGMILAQTFGTLDALLAADEEQLTQIPDIGAITAQSILAWSRSPQSQHMIQRLREAGVNFASKTQITDRRFEGKTFVLTGTLQHFTREEAEARKAQEVRRADPVVPAEPVVMEVPGNGNEALENRELVEELERNARTAAMAADVPVIEFPEEDGRYFSAKKYGYA